MRSGLAMLGLAALLGACATPQMQSEQPQEQYAKNPNRHCVQWECVGKDGERCTYQRCVEWREHNGCVTTKEDVHIDSSSVTPNPDGSFRVNSSHKSGYQTDMRCGER